MQSLRENTLRAAVLLVISSPAAADCLAAFLDSRATGLQVEGWMDNHGRSVPSANATAMSYALCIQTCGSGAHFRTWNVFSQRFSTWLLPFLALVSQLPFGANNRLDNLMSILLNVGSPTLGAYSVIHTLLSGRWVARRFSRISYPNARSAGRILNMLQQVPLKVTTEDGLLASLIVLPENDEWWADLLVWLDINYIYTWSFANVASIGWVVIAFSLTVVDIYTALTTNPSPPLNSDGLAVAFAWLWLLPIVISWLQFGPRENEAEPTAIELETQDGNFGVDEHRTPPVYNYARIFHWNAAVEAVYSGFSEASRRAQQRTPVEGTAWITSDREVEIHLENRRGSLEHVSNYICGEDVFKDRWISSGIVCRMFVSAIFALLLTWGTISAAILLEWLTPTIGLSCRSGSYLMYASVSTIVWVLLVISSVLSSGPNPSSHLQQTSVFLRRSGKSLAVLNSAWIILICIFQFAGVYDTCWCNGSVLYLGSRSYTVWIMTPADIAEFWYPVAGGTVLASVTVIAFLVFTYILLDPQSTS
ncbi:hypothetical protein B0H13DRAFT_1864141 [Mycena leptocephala]|nr:hypothetical protein B0H13DRAFT_1864141 [Mycena leptocephala]